ncbi:hypothetical protein AVEN_82124-1, partial [Araneus ventricosus]
MLRLVVQIAGLAGRSVLTAVVENPHA